ncbi:hypothetical protein FLAG1_08395 [Fusarium langsethiae]|uniref:Ubiquitin-like protease family profile domain-containing protein n=1 Tax=Fusarium langsethiae TaxID=179993 RepID=A0A0N0DCV5_FUSLA|nr:hypothetical protein FLAG1_08395 [Fusarium langsethiae]
MFPTSGQSTADLDPPISLSRTSVAQPERDPTTCVVEPLTPCTADHHSSQDTHSPERTASAARSLLHLLRLPLILDGILRNVDEGEQLSQRLRSALSQRSVRERQRIRSFANDLCCACDDLLDEGPSLVDEDIDAEGGQAHQQKHKGEAAVEDRAGLEPSMEPPVPICLAAIAGKKKDDTVFERCDEMVSSGTQPRMDHNAATQFDLQDTEKSGPRLPEAEVADIGGLNSEAFCTATFRPSSPVGKSICSRLVAEDSSTSAVKAAPLVTFPKATPSIEPLTPERTPSRTGFREVTVLTPPKDNYLLDQVIGDFIHDSYEQVRRFNLPGNSQETYKALFDSLPTRATQVDREQKDEILWSGGSQWVSLLEAGYGERQKGTIAYALTALSFARWHASQVQLIDGATTTQGAAQGVSARILGPRPRPEDENGLRVWERSRKKLNTHLARGRKWARLVEELGIGILLKNPWQLAKSSQPQLDILIRGLLGDPEKMTVLELLTDQVALFLDIGKTDSGKFRKDLETEGLPLSSPLPPLKRGELGDLYTLVRDSIDGDRLLIAETDFEFGVESIQKLDGTTWLNDEVILACLHLSDRLPFVRIGFSIPVHQQTEVHRPMPRPFERAAKQLEEWRSMTEEQSWLICFFPLLQHENHFSLLEVNERERCVFHYDSLSKGECNDIKVQTASLGSEHSTKCLTGGV